MSPSVSFIADRGDAGLRLDQVLVRRVTEVSGCRARTAQRWIEGGAVVVDARAGHAARRQPCSRAPRSRDAAARRGARAPPAPEPGALEVLYEDDYLLAVNKPAGVVGAPHLRQTSGTLLNAVLWQLRDRPASRPAS